MSKREQRLREQIALEVENFYPDPHEPDEHCDDCDLLRLVADGIRNGG
jgi:hypothetical protein